jgi:hypothetical protein
MGQTSAIDLSSNPTASKPFGINAASNIAGTARRVPPLHFFDRMHSATLPGRCDFVLDLIISGGRSADPDATKTAVIPFNGTSTPYPKNANFTYVPGIENASGGMNIASTSHLKGPLPAGANVISLDGHVEWRPWNADTSFVAGDGLPQASLTFKYWAGVPPYFWYPAPP